MGSQPQKGQGYHTLICMYIYIYIYIYLSLYIYIYITYRYRYVNKYIYIYICMYVCMYVCMYTLIHTRTYTHMHAPTQELSGQTKVLRSIDDRLTTTQAPHTDCKSSPFNKALRCEMHRMCSGSKGSSNLEPDRFGKASCILLAAHICQSVKKWVDIHAIGLCHGVRD